MLICHGALQPGEKVRLNRGLQNPLQTEHLFNQHNEAKSIIHG